MNALADYARCFPLLNKPVMITGASYGTLGASRAQLQLRPNFECSEIKANVLQTGAFHVPFKLLLATAI